MSPNLRNMTRSRMWPPKHRTWDTKATDSPWLPGQVDFLGPAAPLGSALLGSAREGKWVWDCRALPHSGPQETARLAPPS